MELDDIKKLSKEHLRKIGKRMKSIRKANGFSSASFEKKLSLPGAVMTRFENGEGIQIFNLLNILTWLDSEGYNIKWLLLLNNENEFEKNQDSLALYTDVLPANTFKKQEIFLKTEKISNLVEEIKNLTEV